MKIVNSNQNSKQINNLTSAFDKEKHENAKLTAKIYTLEERLIKMEAQSMRDNLLINGINETDIEDCEDLIKNIFRSKLNMNDVVSIQIVCEHRLGSKRTNMCKPRTIIVKFQLYKDPIRVWRAIKNLQGSNIFINEDFLREINDRRRTLRPILRKAKVSGKEAFLNVHKQIIEGRCYI